MVICVFYGNTKWGGLQEEHPLKSPMVERFHSTMGDSHCFMCFDSQMIQNIHIGQCIRLTHTSSVHQHTITGIILIIQIILCMQYQIIVNYKRLLLICHGIVHQFIDGCQFLIHCIKNLFGFFRCSKCIGNSQTCIVCITIPGNDSIIRITRKIRRIAIIKA